MNSLRPTPSLGQALKKACSVFVSHFGQVLLFLLVQITIRLAALAPLILLLIPGYEAWALLVIPGFVLLVIPARQRAAYAYRSLLHGKDLFIPELGVGWRSYPVILCKGLRTGICLLPWFAPLLGVAIWLAIFLSAKGVQGQNDFFTVFSQLLAFGGGNIMRVVLYIGLIVAGLLLMPVIGCAFHSGARHDFTQDRRKIRGLKHRGRAVAAWLAGALLYLPYIVLVGIMLWGMFGGILKGIGLVGGNTEEETAALQQTATEVANQAAASGNGWRYWVMAAGFVLLAIPATVLKGLFSAAAVDSLWEND